MAPFLHFADQKETVYTPVPTLEHIAALKLVIDLWNQNDIRVLFNQLRYSNAEGYHRRRFWDSYNRATKAVQRCVWSRLRNIPEGLVQKVLHLVRPICDEICNWKEYHELRFEESLDKDLLLPDELCWTVHGTIDRKKTAQALIRDQNICIMLRFKFACAYCLESDIRALWDGMPELYRDNLHREQGSRGMFGYKFFESFMAWKNLLRLWCRAMKGEIDFGHMFDHVVGRIYLIEQITHGCNPEVLEYFFPKLTLAKKQEFIEAYATSLTKYTPSMAHHPKVYFFLLSQLNGEQQRSVFSGSGYTNVVKMCLEWPWHDLLTEVLRHSQCFLPGFGYRSILCAVYNCAIKLKRLQYYPKCYNYYQCIFEDILELCPKTDKSIFTTETCVSIVCLLHQMIRNKDKHNILLIWNYATVAQKEDIICYCKKTEKHITENWKDMYPFVINLLHS